MNETVILTGNHLIYARRVINLIQCKKILKVQEHIFRFLFVLGKSLIKM